MKQFLTLTIPGGGNNNPIEIQHPSEIPTGGLEAGGTGTKIIQNSITLFLILLTFVSLFFLIFGGIKWITSEGDKAKMDSARKTIIYSILGLVLAFLSFFIVNLVGHFFGVSYFK